MDTNGGGGREGRTTGRRDNRLPTTDYRPLTSDLGERERPTLNAQRPTLKGGGEENHGWTRMDADGRRGSGERRPWSPAPPWSPWPCVPHASPRCTGAGERRPEGAEPTLGGPRESGGGAVAGTQARRLCHSAGARERGPGVSPGALGRRRPEREAMCRHAHATSNRSPGVRSTTGAPSTDAPTHGRTRPLPLSLSPLRTSASSCGSIPLPSSVPCLPCLSRLAPLPLPFAQSAPFAVTLSRLPYR